MQYNYYVILNENNQIETIAHNVYMAKYKSTPTIEEVLKPGYTRPIPKKSTILYSVENEADLKNIDFHKLMERFLTIEKFAKKHFTTMDDKVVLSLDKKVYKYDLNGFHGYTPLEVIQSDGDLSNVIADEREAFERYQLFKATERLCTGECMPLYASGWLYSKSQTEPDTQDEV